MRRGTGRGEGISSTLHRCGRYTCGLQTNHQPNPKLMTKLKFTNGIEIDTSGQLRTLKLPDGLYIVGQGYCIPVKDEEQAQERIKELQKKASNLT